MREAGEDAAARSVAIDVLKGLAIVGVLVQHGLDGRTLHDAVDLVHVRQAVPIFAILLAYNGSRAFVRADPRRLRDAYSRAYFATRGWRLGVPFLVAFVLAGLVALALGRLYGGPLLLVGYLPLVGPGTYYLTLLAQHVLVFPALWFAFSRRPWLTSAACVAVAVAYDAAAAAAAPFDGATAYLLSAGLPHYLPLLCAGLLLARSGLGAGVRTGLVLLPVSLALLVLLREGRLSQEGLEPFTFWSAYSVYGLGYPLTLVAVALVTAPEWATAPARWRPLVEVGRASYHVFLAQIITFGALPGDGAWPVLAAVLAVLAGLVAVRTLPARRTLPPHPVPAPVPAGEPVAR